MCECFFVVRTYICAYSTQRRTPDVLGTFHPSWYSQKWCGTPPLLPKKKWCGLPGSAYGQNGSGNPQSKSYATNKTNQNILDR